MAKKSSSEVLKDVETLSDPHRFPLFLYSRLFYRTIVSNSGWLAIPLVVALLYRFLIVLGFYFAQHQATLRVLDFLVITDVVVILDGLLILAVVYMLLRHLWKLSASLVDERGNSDHNQATREYAQVEIKDNKMTGGVFGHTHVAELTELGHGFYANSGSGTKITKAYAAKFMLPNIYVPSLQLSWLEFKVGQNLEISLYAGSRRTAGAKGFEKLLLKKPIVYTEAKLVKSLEV